MADRTHAPLECLVDRIVGLFELEAQDIAYWSTEDIDIREAGQFVRTTTAPDDSRLLIADEERGSGSRVVIIKEFEDKSIATLVAASRARREPGVAVSVV